MRQRAQYLDIRTNADVISVLNKNEGRSHYWIWLRENSSNIINYD